MFTKVAKKFIGIPMMSGNYFNNPLPKLAPPGYSQAVAMVSGKGYDGTVRNFCPNFESPIATFFSTSVSQTSNGICVGSDDTPATEDDYTVGQLITGLTGIIDPSSQNQFNITYDAEHSKVSMGLLLTITNNNAESVTVKEICKFGKLYYASQIGGHPANNGEYTAALIDRTVLTNPVTIAAGDSAVIKYEFIVDLSD